MEQLHFICFQSQQNAPQVLKTSRHHDNYSTSLWEWYCDDDNEEARGDNPLRNIRGFLMKRRKSPLKGYQKVLVKGHLFTSLGMLGSTVKFSFYLPLLLINY